MYLFYENDMNIQNECIRFKYSRTENRKSVKSRHFKEMAKTRPINVSNAHSVMWKWPPATGSELQAPEETPMLHFLKKESQQYSVTQDNQCDMFQVILKLLFV